MQMTKLLRKGPVLVVDDDETFLRSLSDIVESWGYPVLHTTRGKEALQMIRKKPVKAVLLDYQMPEMNGIECLGYIHRLYPLVSVIMITAYSFEPQAFIDLGAAAALQKPFDPALLRQLLDKLPDPCSFSEVISDT